MEQLRYDEVDPVSSPTASDIGPTASEIFEQVQNAPYVSKTRIGKQLAREIAAHRINLGEFELLERAARERREELRIAEAAEPPVDDTPPPVVEEEWTPTAVLDRLDLWDPEPPDVKKLQAGDRD